MRVRILMVGLAACAIALAGSCRKEQPAPPATSTAPAPQAAEATPVIQSQPPVAAPPAEAKPTKSELGDAYTANKKRKQGTRPNDEKLERELSQLRPKHREYVSLSGKDIDVEFTGAKVGSGDFHLCDLSFELSGAGSSVATTMTDKQRDVSMAVDLGWCKVKVKPFVGKPKVEPIGAGQVLSRITRAGRYDVVLLDKSGKPMGIAQVTEDRRLLAGKAYPGYSCNMRRDPEWEGEQLFNLSKVSSDGSTTKVVQLRWQDQALTHHQVIDLVGNIYEHAFPAGELEVINPAGK